MVPSDLVMICFKKGDESLASIRGVMMVQIKCT